MFKIIAFLSVFIELFCYLNFLFTLYHFLVDLYPCMIILKYNQTFGVLFLFFIFEPCNLSFIHIYKFLLFVFICILSTTTITNEYAQ